MNEIIIGIDLGTTNSEVSIVENGKVTVISNGDKKMLPSFVGMDDNAQIIVGETARNQYLVYPERTIKSIKRLMGQDAHVELAGQTYTPQEISAIILKRLKAIAENYLGQTVSKAVITVPAYFSDAQRQATREAGEIAGLEVMRMINEPTAAALAYDANQSEAKHVLVYDLGGGTFDVSVVNIESGVVEVLSSHGDNQLGGDDFDQQIIEYLLEHIQDSYQVDVRTHSKAMARITRAAEEAKFILSDQPYAQIDEEYLLEHEGVAIHLSHELSRMAYEEMIEDYINATLDAVHIALKGAKFTTTDIDEIILVGGSTRTPCIRERLLNEFGFEPHSEVDPDLCVVMGAAIQAAMIAGQDVDTVLVDVTPYTYGTSAIGSLDGQPYPFMFVPIIHKNTVLPNRKSDAFATSFDGQEAVEITVYQGEDPDALRNVKIGEFRVEGLLDVVAGNIITLTLALDLNGILQVSAQEKDTGLEKSITIKNALSQFEDDALDAAKQRINSLLGQMDPRVIEHEPAAENEQSVAPEIEAAQELIVKAEGLFEQVSNEDKEDMIDLIETLTVCIAARDIQGLDDPMTELSDIIYYLES
ncbi:molecular chaperone DnaK [Bathymodiolus platifrons methanotrophic gill symbiont]|uniref:Hsp70 family protein n=1 Tax=Bathymodiolus platifrons methanotrophic gill symbiont TaxID=113268 RepID=UPI000B423530|nr:Hsp70 family protein [Bathymodiolus platifrons methanotrophic gill symbiont]GAW85722.1 molecular chaperone DnaK [Bathymodiolus platifrons methanotrophic gill symbiont]GFO73989.1 molecular chaperone DnaK [Bathymodiolus platifrons methanotrophic gill symbiont]